MGRHSAPSSSSPAPGPFRDDATPITDPRLFDRPLPVAAPPTDRLPDRDARPSAAPERAVHTPPVPVPPSSVPEVAPVHQYDVDDEPIDDIAGTSPFQPKSVRADAPRGVERVVPQVAGASLLGLRRENVRPVRPQDLRYARTGEIPVVADEIDTEPPVRHTRRREALLAAAALAVVGAVSGAAALLPSNAADAQNASQTQPITSPVPRTASATGGRTCVSSVQLTQATRTGDHGAGALRQAGSGGTAAPAVALPASVSNLPAGLFDVTDFSTKGSGRLVSDGVLKGAGAGSTVVQMAKDTSTRAHWVPGDGNNQGGLANPTNPLWLVSGVKALEDVTVQGTEQGHLYNGVSMTGANLVIKDAQVNDIPGDSSANPGETFAVGINRATGTGTVDNLSINGGSGPLASAAGLAINNSAANWDISGLTTKNLRYSAGIALWQVRGTFDIHHFVQSGGARSLGAERMAGTVNLYDPVWSAGTTGHDVTYTWDGGYSGGSINFFYSSPSNVPDRKIRIITNKARGIERSVHVYVGGVEKTASDYVTVS